MKLEPDYRAPNQITKQLVTCKSGLDSSTRRRETLSIVNTSATTVPQHARRESWRSATIQCTCRTAISELDSTAAGGFRWD